jgi:hypothetical protein
MTNEEKNAQKRQTGLTGFRRLNQKGTSLPLFLIVNNPVNPV